MPSRKLRDSGIVRTIEPRRLGPARRHALAGTISPGRLAAARTTPLRAGPVLGTGVLLEERDHQFGDRLGGLRVRVVPGAADHGNRT